MQFNRRRAMHPPTPGRATPPPVHRASGGHRAPPPTRALRLGPRPPHRDIDALLVALHFEGCRLDTLLGLLQATQRHCLAIASDRPVVALPAYGGPRVDAETVALLALALARDGHRVLVHGPLTDAGRLTPAAVLGTLGLPLALGALDAHAAWARREPAFVPTDRLCPPLAALLERRLLLGVRGPAGLVAALLRPVHAPRVLHLLHPDADEAGSLLAQWAARAAADVVLAGGSASASADGPGPAPFEIVLGGVARPDLAPHAGRGPASPRPAAGSVPDPAASARRVQELLSGASPLPDAPQRALDAVAVALAEIERRPQGTGSALY